MVKMIAIDSHCHADIAMNRIPTFLEKYYQQGISFISWSYAEGIKSYRDYPIYWSNLQRICEQCRQSGLPAWYLVGIHPRCIPEDLKDVDRLPKIIEESLIKHVNAPYCLGLGEIGLDLSSEFEKRFFRLQLEFAEEHIIPKKRIGVHTPRKNKLTVTQEILEILGYYELLHSFLVIDHVLPETFELVLENGYTVGVTLQDGKASVKDLLELIEKYPEKMSAVMLNSDCAKEFSRPYLEFLEEVELVDKKLKEGLLFQNCCSFFGINKGGF